LGFQVSTTERSGSTDALFTSQSGVGTVLNVLLLPMALSVNASQPTQGIENKRNADEIQFSYPNADAV
jgi:hypothetical protein